METKEQLKIKENFKRIGIYTVDAEMKVIKRLRQEALKKGYKPEVILFNDIHIAVRSPKKFRIYHKNETYTPPKVIINRLPAVAPGLALLILSQFERTRRSRIINRAFRTAIARDKFRTIQVLASKGFSVPNTVLLGSSKERNLNWAVKGVGGFPAILKLTRGSLGMGVVRVDNMSTLRSVLDLVKRTKSPMILQQYIASEPGVDYRFYVVGKKVVGAMKRATKKKGEFRANISLGGYGEKYKPTPSEEKLALDISKAVGLEVCGVDLIRTEAGLIPIEVNVNAMLKGIEKATGLNIAGKIIDYCIEEGKRFLEKRSVSKKQKTKSEKPQSKIKKST